ncbi:MAG: hypothetical protein EZS28_026509 [Streblomastix strix]|uniref:Uncharacterized protein n=1 Tax=Streblomastix strix TaxID=222440 RepID=A0A5J4V5Z4_9EUKA|nr:MAG: hypothetical protein EZS28_026509 [Streblomastix strix]
MTICCHNLGHHFFLFYYETLPLGPLPPDSLLVYGVGHKKYIRNMIKRTGIIVKNQKLQVEISSESLVIDKISRCEEKVNQKGTKKTISPQFNLIELGKEMSKSQKIKQRLKIKVLKLSAVAIQRDASYTISSSDRLSFSLILCIKTWQIFDHLPLCWNRLCWLEYKFISLYNSHSTTGVVQNRLVVPVALLIWTFSSDDGLGKNTEWERERNEVSNGDNIISSSVGNNLRADLDSDARFELIFKSLSYFPNSTNLEVDVYFIEYAVKPFIQIFLIRKLCWCKGSVFLFFSLRIVLMFWLSWVKMLIGLCGFRN